MRERHYKTLQLVTGLVTGFTICVLSALSERLWPLPLLLAVASGFMFIPGWRTCGTGLFLSMGISLLLGVGIVFIMCASFEMS